jgi:cytochrome c biogenesis protein CcmG/thiol:disulfide interchange protein DsbE
MLSCNFQRRQQETASKEISAEPGAETELIQSPVPVQHSTAPALHSTAPRMNLIPISIYKSGSDLKVEFALQNDSDNWYDYTVWSPIESIYLETAEGNTYQATQGSLMSFGYVPPGFTIRGETLYLEFLVPEGTSGYKVTIPSYTARDENGKKYEFNMPFTIDLEQEVYIPAFPFETPRFALRKIGDQIELSKLAALSISDAHMTGQGLVVNYIVQNLSSEHETTVQVDTSIIGENGLVVWGTTPLPPGEHGSVELNLGLAQMASKQMTANVPEGGHYYLILDVRAVSGRSSPSLPSHLEVVDLGKFAYPTTLRFVALTKVNKGITIDQELQTITSAITLDNVSYPVLSGLPSKGGCIPGSALDYDYIRNTFGDVYIEKSNGSQNPIKVSSDGLAIRPGTFGKEPLIAWGTYAYGDPSYLQISNLDGSQVDTLYTITSTVEYPLYLTVDSWSADGNAIYFSKESSGISFNRYYKPASNLYRIDIRTKEVTNIIGEVPYPNSSPYFPYPCIDSISRDNRYVADHCTPGVITIHDIQRKQATAIQIPLDIPSFSEYVFVDTALFSPNGDRVAFAMEQMVGENNFRTWIAVGDSSGGSSNVILESSDGNVYYLLGWLNNNTLLVQFQWSNCYECNDQIYTIGADGSNLTQWTSGSLVTVLDCSASASLSNVIPTKEATATPTVEAPLQIGSKVQDFSLITFDDQTIKLSDQKGKVVLINFWASWAVPCEHEAPIVQAAWEYYQQRSDVIFIGINIDNIYYKENVLAFIDKYGITYPNGNDIEQTISQQFQLMGVPETYIIDKNGNLSFDNIYPFTSVDDIKSLIDPLLEP